MQSAWLEAWSRALEPQSMATLNWTNLTYLIHSWKSPSAWFIQQPCSGKPKKPSWFLCKKQVAEVCSVQLNRRMTVAVKKKERELENTRSWNSIGKVSHRDRTPSFFWRPWPIRMKYNLPKKIYVFIETFSLVCHNFLWCHGNYSVFRRSIPQNFEEYVVTAPWWKDFMGGVPNSSSFFSLGRYWQFILEQLQHTLQNSEEYFFWKHCYLKRVI